MTDESKVSGTILLTKKKLLLFFELENITRLW